MAKDKNKNKHVKPKYPKKNSQAVNPSKADSAKAIVAPPRELDSRIVESIHSNIPFEKYEAEELGNVPELVLQGAEYQNRDNTPMTKFVNLENTAPYNFVRLSKQLVLPPIGHYIGKQSNKDTKVAAYKEYLLGEGKYAKHTGYFDVFIENITPLYISDGKSFFTDGKNICIPGSSLRGALKNIFGIITNSGFRPNEDFTDTHIYYREIASKSHLKHLKDEYLARITETDSDNNRSFKIKAGYLVRKNNEYHIIPTIRPDSTRSSNFLEMKGTKIIREYKTENETIEIYVGLKPNIVEIDRFGKKIYKAGMLWHDEYVDVFSGEMQTKKCFYRFGAPDIEEISEALDDKLLNEYWNDRSKGRLSLCSRDGKAEKENLKLGFAQKGGCDDFVDQKLGDCYRDLCEKKSCLPVRVKANKKGSKYADDKEGKYKIGLDDPEVAQKAQSLLNHFAEDREPLTGPSSLLYGLSDYDYIIPCFYQAEGKKVTSFGANPYYRIPYINSIADAVPDALKDTSNEADNTLTDFTTAIFGSLDNWGSRVFVEDCLLVSEKVKREQRHEAIPLRTPNPSSYQNYLEQYGSIANWDVGNADIRGNKLYWHRDMDWRDETELAEEMKTYLEPLEAHHTFRGRIRFENLDDIELGALAKIFDLASKPNIALKIGMGKSIGLGSIKVSAELFEENHEYLTSLFSTDGTLVDYKAVKYNSYVTGFDNYMDEQLEKQGAGAAKIYKERMEELKLILSTDLMNNKEFKKKTDYLPFEERDPETGKPIINPRTGKPKPNKETQQIYSMKTPLPDIKTIVKSIKEVAENQG